MLIKKISRCILSGIITISMIVPAALPVTAVDQVEFRPTPNYLYQDNTADAGARIDDLLSRMTLNEKVTRSAGNGAIARLNLTAGRGGSSEGLHGAAWSAQATVFPNSLGLSQSWDKELFSKIGEVIAKEFLAGGVNNAGALAPVVDLLRDPRYGRAYETLGEDAYLTGSLAIAMASGMNQRTEEGYQQFIPILKHFMGYNAEINRLWVASSLTPRPTNEYYNKAFKYPVAAGASKSLMNSYPVVNGKPMSVNPLQHDLLYDWTPDYEGTGHYEYITMNDYGSGSSVFVHSQRYFNDDTLGRALGMAEGAKNGQMPWSFRDYGSDAGLKYEALARGMATEKDYEELARRSLTMQLRLGDMDQLGIQSPYLKNPSSIYGPNRAYQMDLNKALALQASQEQIVLLKNDGVLPLSGTGTSKAILLGPLSDQILKDFYSGSYRYRITIKDALENKLGASNVFFNRAIDTVAIKSVSTGKYLVGSATTTYNASGTGSAAIVNVTGETKPASINDTANRASLFEVYDYGSANWLLRTPVNGRYVQVANGSGAYARTMVNNTSAPGEGNINETASGQNLQFSNFQKFRLAPTSDGHMAIYHHLSGDGNNGGIQMAYDVDDEDVNRGSYLYVNAANRVVPDIARTNGPWQTEYNVVSPVDAVSGDGKIDKLPDDSFKFDFESIQSVEEAANQAITAANDPAAPVILVLGTEPHLNSREAVDLYKTGLSDQQMVLINYVTKKLSRDVILIVKTGNPMTIDRTVAENAKIKAILEIGSTGQEEGAAIVSALFDDGYTIPATGFAPANTGQFTMNTGTGTNGPNQPYAAYPGYINENRHIPAYAPAGRLSATWYDGIDQMIGASEEHPPASYMYPDYNEATNDNMSNMNGTINTGLLTYDIIKGERTYQYLNKTPLYAFGYGLTYTPFTYSSLAVSPASDGKFTVSGKVTNAGAKYTSDEVVQIYSSYAGTPSRIKQAKKKLIAYDRVKNIAPGETKDFSFEIDLIDKLGVWDVETENFIVEPGNYTIKAGSSSDAAGVSVTFNAPGTAAPARDLSKVTLAENFDDYSNVGGKVDDVEMVSSSVEYDSNTAVQFRKNGAWISFKDVVFSAAPGYLTIRSGSDRAGKLSVYALPAGSDPSALASATAAASFNLTNTRVGVSATGLGIGPVGVMPGSIAGQAYKDAYVKPEYKTLSANVSGINAGARYDLYILTENRGTVMDWFKFGVQPDTTEAVEIYSIYSADSIREFNGELQLSTKLTPVSSIQPVVWSVAADENGAATNLAEITADGLLKAKGTANGDVFVTAVSGSAKAVYKVMITNQLPANKVTISGAAKTIDYLLVRTGTTFGSGDSISAYQGTSQQGLASREIFSENASKYIATATFLTVPTNAATWSISDLDGNPTDLATVSATGLISATGVDDGKVLVTATLINNPDIVGTRVITLTNQGKKDAFKMIQAKDFNPGSVGMGAGTSAYAAAGGNEIGYYSQASNTATSSARAYYRKVDFTGWAGSFHIRTASTVDTTVSVWADNYTEADGGTLLGTLALPATGNTGVYATKSMKLDNTIEGIHDLYLVFGGATGSTVRVNWFQFERGANIAADSANTDVRLVSVPKEDAVDKVFSFSISSIYAVKAQVLAAAYDKDGRLISINKGDEVDLAANAEGLLEVSLPKYENAASYKIFVWDSNFIPLARSTSY